MGIIALAERQTRGKGKGNNCWYSPQGGLWFSFLIDSLPLEKRVEIPVMIVKNVKSMLSDFGIESSFKRPNDLLVNKKKISGTLIETYEEFCIVGVGINVNNDIENMPKDVAEKSIAMKNLVSVEIKIEKVFVNLMKKIEISLKRKLPVRN